MTRPEPGVAPWLAAAGRRLWRWGPVLLWMAGILIFSTRRQPLGPLSRSSHSGLVGRVAHVAEYAGLTALLYRAARGGSRRGLRLALGVGLAGLAFALADELYQGWVPGRTRALADLGWDLLGVLVGLGASLAWEMFGQNVGRTGCPARERDR